MKQQVPYFAGHIEARTTARNSEYLTSEDLLKGERQREPRNAVRKSDYFTLLNLLKEGDQRETTSTLPRKKYCSIKCREKQRVPYIAKLIEPRSAERKKRVP